MMTRFNLTPAMFEREEKLLCEAGSMRAWTFRYSTGVCGLRVENSRGYFTILPFQGQQIWRAAFDGHDLWMKTGIAEPVPNTSYLGTYGGFLLHCGLLAMGCPGPDDDHPQHGELPNMAYNNAALIIDEDEKGPYMAVTGTYEHNIAFVVHYSFAPTCRLYADASTLDVSFHAQNLRKSPMEYMFLSHINFRPYDGGRLIYSAKPDPEHITVHYKYPADMPEEKKRRHVAFLDAVSADPKVHHEFTGNEPLDPEMCLTIMYEADADGLAHTMQLLPDGYAHYVAHNVEKMPYVIRWLSRTGDEDSCGMCLPATAEHNGKAKAKADGQVKVLGGGECLDIAWTVGLLTPDCAEKMRAHIADMI
ncbi:MAG: DUF4432 family protein [Ruminococcaceae bacterium]|nr:DUF4432 family protein [Oscillospiraceae bacterium]